MKKSNPFSVVIATYTGTTTIEGTFNSLLKQQAHNAEFEIIVIIDGPSKILKQKVDEAARKFRQAKIPFIMKQFTENKGRFDARLAGARLAKTEHILIVDDRVELPGNFFQRLLKIDEEVVIPDVEEKPANNFVSLTLNSLRHKIYGRRWGTDFEPYYIDKTNFDSSPKGTTTLWVNKSMFINACEAIAKELSSTNNVNEDTRILKYLVGKGSKIFKTSELRVAYEPRASAKEELIHIYHRGPRFIDYYLRPGSRYFLPLVAFYLSIFPALLMVILWPISLAFVFAGLLLAGLLISGNLKNWLKISIGLGAVILFFGAGLWAGLISKVIIR